MIRPTPLQAYQPVFRLVFATVIAARDKLRTGPPPSQIPHTPDQAQIRLRAELTRAQREVALSFPNAIWLNDVHTVVECWTDDYLSNGFIGWSRGSLAGQAYMGKFKEAAKAIVQDHLPESDVAASVVAWCLDHGFEFEPPAGEGATKELSLLMGSLRKRMGVEPDARPGSAASAILLKAGASHKPLGTLLQGWHTKRLARTAIVVGAAALLVFAVALFTRYVPMKSEAMSKPMATMEWKAQP